MTDSATNGGLADVAVVIPCYNGAEFVAESIASALDQSPRVAQVVVVDDGSTDRSIDVISEFLDDPRLTLVQSANGGAGRARNLGTASCSPEIEFVLFLDADDRLTHGAIGPLRRRFDIEPDLVAVFGGSSRIDEDGREIAAVGLPLGAIELDGLRIRHRASVERVGLWRMLPVTPISSPGQCLLRRATFDLVGGCDALLANCEDWDLWVRMVQHGDFGTEHRHVLEYRDHTGGKSKNHRRSRAHRDLVYRRQRALGRHNRRRLALAHAYGMYGYDAALCRRWAVDAARDRRAGASARYLVRMSRYAVRYGSMVVSALATP